MERSVKTFHMPNFRSNKKISSSDHLSPVSHDYMLHSGRDRIDLSLYNPYFMALLSVFVYTRLLSLLNFPKINMISSKAGAIWDYFDKPAKFNDADADVNVKAKCKVCSDLMSCSKKKLRLIWLNMCRHGYCITAVFKWFVNL
jgi:hypothetical protein